MKKGTHCFASFFFLGILWCKIVRSLVCWSCSCSRISTQFRSPHKNQGCLSVFWFALCVFLCASHVDFQNWQLACEKRSFCVAVASPKSSEVDGMWMVICMWNNVFVEPLLAVSYFLCLQNAIRRCDLYVFVLFNLRPCVALDCSPNYSPCMAQSVFSYVQILHSKQHRHKIQQKHYQRTTQKQKHSRTIDSRSAAHTKQQLKIIQVPFRETHQPIFYSKSKHYRPALWWPKAVPRHGRLSAKRRK